MGETTPRLTSGKLRRPFNGTLKYGRDHGLAQEASLIPIRLLNNPQQGDRIQQ